MTPNLFAACLTTHELPLAQDRIGSIAFRVAASDTGHLPDCRQVEAAYKDNRKINSPCLPYGQIDQDHIIINAKDDYVRLRVGLVLGAI